MQQVILASASKQRKAFLELFAIPFITIPANVDEKVIQDPNPTVRVEKLARAKAEKVASEHTGIIIAGDTFVVCQNRVLEKPMDREEAKEMMEVLSGNTGAVYTGFCYIDTMHAINFSTAVVIPTVFRKFAKQEIDDFVHLFPVTTWAGGISPAYPYGSTLIAEINGSFTGFMYGLPVEFLLPCLEKSGIPVTVRRTS